MPSSFISFLWPDLSSEITMQKLVYIKAVQLFQSTRSVTLAWPGSSTRLRTSVLDYSFMWLMGTISLFKLWGAGTRKQFCFLNFSVGFEKRIRKRSNYIQIPEVFIRVKGISYNKLVWISNPTTERIISHHLDTENITFKSNTGKCASLQILSKQL